ncbi:MAG: S-methyl-5-thioribose-1-phosphate isomerase [Chloroflexi bacterium]|nr:S-methyl-5-thioribose-1-phosphate isomerase [Chloroflexota bacterium]
MRNPTGFRTPFRFESDHVLLVIDQRTLPNVLVELPVRSAHEGARVIREMAVRGAPAIGQVAALSLALSAWLARNAPPTVRRSLMGTAARTLREAHPTAVNLGWAVGRVMVRFDELDQAEASGVEIAAGMRAEAEAIVAEATDDHGRLADAGLAVLPEVGGRAIRLLTHGNTGPLACGQFGTALGIIQAAHHAARPVHVWVGETRPYLEGARLTAWELAQAGVPHTLVSDVAAGSLMAAGDVDAVLVGADRIAANGDTANKVGTYALAVLAARHHVPFHVCAPLSSVDLATPDGTTIPVEERSAEEVVVIGGTRIAPEGTLVRNPPFDVTPADLITGIVTEEGVLRAPFGPSLQAAMARRNTRREAERSTVIEAPSPAGSEAPSPAGSDSPSPAGSDSPSPAGSDSPSGAGSDSPSPAGSDSPEVGA